MKYKIEWLEKKQTSTGKTKYDASLKSEDGKVIDNVTIWESFPGFNDLKPGHDIEADVVSKQNGQYTNVTAFPLKTSVPRGNTGVKAAQERKAQMIEEAQERKNEAISFFNATNSAITLFSAYQARAQYPLTEEGTETFIRKWRKWFLDEWQKYEAGDKTDKHQAF